MLSKFFSHVEILTQFDKVKKLCPKWSVDFKSFSKKQKIIIIASAILILAIPLTAYLAQKTQIFKPRAEELSQITHNVFNFDPRDRDAISP